MAQYTYYQRVISEEHYYFAEEVSEMLKLYGKHYSANQIHALMREHEKNTATQPLYYQTSRGLKKVYDLKCVFELIEEQEQS